MRLQLKNFVAGSSIIAVMVTFIYVFSAWRKAGKPESFPIMGFVFLVPVLFGIWNVVLQMVVRRKKKWSPRIIYVIGGAIFGLMLSFLGSRVLGVPEKLSSFGYPDKPWLPLVTAPFLYAAIWGVLVYAANQWVK